MLETLKNIKRKIDTLKDNCIYGTDVFDGLTLQQKNILSEKYQAAYIQTDAEKIKLAEASARAEFSTMPTSIEHPSANNEWQGNIDQLTAEVLAGSSLSNFTNWDVIRATMFHECSPRELLQLRNSSQWDTYAPFLREDTVGNPHPHGRYPLSSGNRIHTLYNLHQLRRAFSLDVSSLTTIFEFGGGYGSMAQLIYKLGFSGSYTLYDIPEFSALQKFYLASLGLYPSKKISFLHDQKTLPSIDLFIATWSLSESPIEVRTKIWSMVGMPRFILLAYQTSFEHVNNKNYFQEFKKGHSGYTWVEYPIQHLPGSFYLLGKKN